MAGCGCGGAPMAAPMAAPTYAGVGYPSPTMQTTTTGAPAAAVVPQARSFPLWWLLVAFLVGREFK